MTSKRPKIKGDVRKTLIREAGGKCANPGCSNTLTEIHHIREWSVYFSHDPEHMIAICPTCHDAVSRGELKITADIAYSWKRISRTAHTRGYLYVEPAETPPRLVAGTLSLRGTSGLVVFSENPLQRLSFRLNAMDIMSLEATVTSLSGVELARVVDGHFQVMAGSAATLAQRPGQFRITHPLSDQVMPDWALSQMREFEPDFAIDGSPPLLDMEVLSPNVVRVQGIWLAADGGLIITKRAVSFVRRGSLRPISLVGESAENTVLNYAGPADQALFVMAHQQESA
jgi:hypothetical protein